MFTAFRSMLKPTIHQWNLTQVPNESNTWTIVSVEDQAGVTYSKTDQTYWGYGYPYPKKGPSQKWSILERTSGGQTFSKFVPILDVVGRVAYHSS